MRRLIATLLVLAVASPVAAARVRAIRELVTQDPATWLRQNASRADDVSAITGRIGDARVIALGDATHGTHELFAMKVRLIQHLVEHGGVRTIAIEAPYAEFAAIGDYVRTGQGDPSLLLQSADYFFWDTDEMLGLIEWVRARNAAGAPPVTITGVDTAHPHPVMERVLAALDAGTRADVAQRYACLAAHAESPWQYDRLSREARAACRDSIASVRPLLAAAGAAEEVLHAARVVEQGEETLAIGMPARDPAMAENIERLSRTSRVVVWGHNEHFSRVPHTVYTPEGTPSSGTYLARALGDDYYVIGSTVHHGLFWAMQYVGGRGVVTPQTTMSASADDIATYLRTAGQPDLFLPLRGLLPYWLASPRTIRIAGSSVASPQKTMTSYVQQLPARYDALFYVERSTPTLLRHFP